jgi:hypothetical protein
MLMMEMPWSTFGFDPQPTPTFWVLWILGAGGRRLPLTSGTRLPPFFKWLARRRVGLARVLSGGSGWPGWRKH